MKIKAQKLLLITITCQFFLLAFFGYSIQEEITYGFLTLPLIILCSYLIFYAGYSLGWEYKRMDIENED